MNGTNEPTVQSVADSIAAQDLAEGRPGKGEVGGPLVEPPEGRGCGGCLPALICLLIGLAIGGIAFVVGYYTASSTGGTVMVTQPDFPVSLTTLTPETTTTPGNANFNGQVQILFQPTCNGKTNRFELPGQFTLNNGTFFLDPQGIPPWNGKVGSDNKVTATGQLGTLTGTLVSGTNLPLTLNTQVFPCPSTYPVIITLPTPITVGPTTTTGSPLAGLINSGTAFNDTTTTSGGGRMVSWPLVIGGGVIDLAALGYLAAKFLFGDDDEFDYLLGYDYRRRERRFWK